MFVRVENIISPLHNCVFEAVDEVIALSSTRKLRGVDGNTFYVSKNNCVEISDEEASTIDLANQICYKKAGDVLKMGQRVRFQIDGTTFEGRITHFGGGSYWTYDARSMVTVVFKTHYCARDTVLRMDQLEVIEENPEHYPDEDGELPVGFDFFSYAPIYSYDDYSELYNGERRNESAIGLVLNDTSNDCWRICEGCGRAVLSFEEDEYTCVCSSCYDDSYARCDGCGDIVRSDYLEEVDDGWYCESCARDRRANARSDSLHYYSYKPSPVFRDVNNAIWQYYNVPEDKLFMGVELEIDGGRSRSDCLAELYDESDDEELFYCKEDGSLNENGSGIEIVTHPCTLEYHLTQFPWDEISNIAKSNGYRSHDTTTCGMHVHVSRSALGSDSSQQDLTVAKMMLLMDKFWKKLVVFSRREVEKLNEWAKKPNAGISRRDNANSAVRKAKKACDGGHERRYFALNITNTNTVEFRLFRGTLNPETIKANLQLVSNIVRLAMERDLLGVQDATWEDLVKIQEYPELNAYLAKKGLDNFSDEPLGEVKEANDIETGDTVLCNIDRDNPFPAEVTEIIQPGVFVVRNNAADDDYHIAFADELQLNS